MKIKKSAIFLAVILIFFGLFILWYNNNPEVITGRLLITNPTNPDELYYKIRLFGALELGQAKVVYSDQGGAGICRISAEGGASKLISLFIRNLKASAISEVELKRSLPLKFSYSLVVPGVTNSSKTITYDHDNLTMDLGGVKRLIFTNTQDPLSLTYYLRKQEMVLGKEFDINLNTNQKNYNFLLKVKERKELLIKGRKVVLWLLDGQISRRDKSSRHRVYMQIWLWDEFKVPVLVKTTAGGGEFNMVLTEMGVTRPK